MSRLVALVVLTLAFTPAAVLGALPLVVPAVVAVTASLAAVQLAFGRPAANPVVQEQLAEAQAAPGLAQAPAPSGPPEAQAARHPA